MSREKVSYKHEEEMGWGWDARKLCMNAAGNGEAYILLLIGLMGGDKGGVNVGEISSR